MTSLAASHVRQTASAEGAEGHKGVPRAGGTLGPKLQALVNAVKHSLDEDKKKKLTKLLKKYEIVSGFKVNFEKACVVWLGGQDYDNRKNLSRITNQMGE